MPDQTTGLDLTAARFDVESRHQVHGGVCVCGYESPVSRNMTKHIADHILAAAAPLIEAAARADERAKIAAKIERETVFLGHLDSCQTCITGRRCARIARGGGE